MKPAKGLAFHLDSVSAHGATGKMSLDPLNRAFAIGNHRAGRTDVEQALNLNCI
jgi:hypothetical protein